MNITGKKILLTGASGGIGEAFARMLDHEGAELMLAGRNAASLEKINATLGGRHRIVVADLGTDEGRTAVYTLCCRTGIDMLINNAGISDFAPLEEQQPETICQMIHTNLLAPILLTQSLLPLLKMARAGMVINIGSTFGTIGYPGFSAYSATKFGLRGFTEALRRELGDSTISVRYLSPRATRTDMNSDIVNEMNCALGNATDTPEQVAVALKLLITGKKQSLYLGWPEKLFVRINSLFPSLVDGAIAKQLSTILAFARRARSIL